MIEFPESNAIEISLYGRRIGRLAQTPDGLCAFQYEEDFVRDGFSVSPLKLPLASEVIIAKPQPFDGGFGVFDDSLPDGWGRLVQDRWLRANGVAPDRLSVLQRLSLTGKNGRGALEYAPSVEMLGTNAKSLPALARQAARLFASPDLPDEDVEALYRYSGSSGGARPKAFLCADGKEWLVKFHASGDPQDIGEKEYETSLLAKTCGIDMPETRLLENRYFATERFDRTSSGKLHVSSVAGLLDADYRIPSLDYTGLLVFCRILTKSMAEVEQLFLRMVFNIAIGNRDDHARNFSFIMDERGEWRLAPAYDLLSSHGFGGYHTTTVNGSGAPTRDDIFAVAAAAGISPKKATEIIESVSSRL
jgi:serine/threonine-protein kinase HipA